MLLAVVSCQQGMTDLGVVEDSSLNQEESLGPLVNGMARALSDALDTIALTGAAVSREVVASGSQFLFGVTPRQSRGILDPFESDEHWNLAHRARWVAEEGVRRMRKVLGGRFPTSRLAARGLLFAGFANRLLGENMCHAVVDGGPAEPRTVHFERSKEAFEEAHEIAVRIGDADLANAALAGRASVRASLGEWAGARADAERIPPGFVHHARYHRNEIDQYNSLYWATAGTPYRSISVWSTFYEGYYLETGDPRTPWSRDPAADEGPLGVPFLRQEKYTSRDAPIPLVDHAEMRLIVAEARLRAGEVPGALAEIEALRAKAGVAPWPAEDLEGTWTALKRERGIELWLEGRRLWDIHRWKEEQVPGEAEDLAGRDTCFPIGATEASTNPNFP